MKPRSKLLKRNYRVSEQGTNRSKETRKFRKRIESFRTRSKPLERNYRVSRKRSKPLERD